MEDCIFCKIASGELLHHKVWEDEKHLAFLSAFPNTPGFTVVITKKHYPSYAFDLPDDVLTELVLATKKVAKLLDMKLEDVGRSAMVFEGFGVDHIHSKLIPMHGTKTDEWKAKVKDFDKYFEKYPGYICTNNYKRADDAELAKIAKKIRE